MNRTEKLKNDILVGMSSHLDSSVLTILEQVISVSLRGVEVKEIETLPATQDNTNDYIKQLFFIKKAAKLSKETVAYYMNTIDELIALINKSLLDINANDIEYYLYQKQQMGNGATSLNNRRRNISAFFTWMRKSKLISDNPCDGIEPYTETIKPIDHLEPDESEELKTGCTKKRDRALIEFMRCTGMRRGEVPQVKISDIDFNSGKIVILGHKTNRYRTVYLDKIAIRYIKDYLDERSEQITSNEPLFVTLNQNKPLSAVGIYAAIKTIAKRSVCKHNIYPHLFRKTCATTIVKRGGSDDMAGDYLGHSPKGVTGRHYIAKDDRHIENIFRNCVAAV